MDWVVAIPSYKRPEQIQKKTLTTLHKGKVSSDKIYVFVVKEDEDDYIEALDPEYYNKIVVGKLGLANQRQFIMDYFPKDKLILFMDDDVMRLVRRISETKVSIIKDLNPMITEGFDVMKSEGANIWGVYPTANPFYMKAGHTTTLRYLVGAFYGIRNTRNPKYRLKYEDNQEDKERTLRYWVEDGVVVRFTNIAPVTSYYAPGGILAREPDRVKKTKMSTELLLKEFPEYVRQVYKKSNDTYDLLFRIGNVSGGGEADEADSGIKELPIRNKAYYEKIKAELLEELRNTTVPKLKGSKASPGRATVIGFTGRSMSFGYALRTFKGYGELVANKNHRELFELLVEFGNAVVPKGWQYETITLNEGVKAKKHKDNHNTGDSVIVGIGDFTGGDIKVWDTDDKNGKVYNLHDQPLMFNGATHFHQTMPFKGERYTMIFYRQKKPGKSKGVTMSGRGEDTEGEVTHIAGGIFA